MHPELTNLLPRSAVRALRRLYFMRLATVAIGLFAVALMVHSILLIPSYVHARGEVQREQDELDQVAREAASSDQKQAAERIQTLENDSTYLKRLSTQPAASGAVRAVLSIPHPSIRITGLTFTAPMQAEEEAQMTITGMSATRDSLRQYVLSLEAAPYISKADLPISAYAKESDIPFTITLTGTLLP